MQHTKYVVITVLKIAFWYNCVDSKLNNKL